MKLTFHLYLQTKYICDTLCISIVTPIETFPKWKSKDKHISINNENDIRPSGKIWCQGDQIQEFIVANS